MLQLLLKIIPLDLASTLSPGILALSLILLGSKTHPRIRTFSLLVGTMLVAIAIAILGFTISKAAPTAEKPTLISALIDLALGLIFIYFGIKQIFNQERKIKEHDDAGGYQIFRWLIIGIIISATNFDAVLLNLAAAKEVGSSAIKEINKIILLAINILFFIAPTSIPFILYLIFPRFAAKFLGKLDKIVLKYSRYILFLMFMIFSIYFLYRGVVFFLVII